MLIAGLHDVLQVDDTIQAGKCAATRPCCPHPAGTAYTSGPNRYAHTKPIHSLSFYDKGEEDPHRLATYTKADAVGSPRLSLTPTGDAQHLHTRRCPVPRPKSQRPHLFCLLLQPVVDLQLPSAVCDQQDHVGVPVRHVQDLADHSHLQPAWISSASCLCDYMLNQPAAVCDSTLATVDVLRASARCATCSW